MKGTVKRWLDQKGYGFIKPEEGEDEIFIHYSEVKNNYDLKEGQEVEFEIETTDKGPSNWDKIPYSLILSKYFIQLNSGCRHARR